LKWLKNGIDIDHLTGMELFNNITNKDSYLKTLKYIELSRADFYNSIARVKQEVDRKQYS
jgi:hypothetical protein